MDRHRRALSTLAGLLVLSGVLAGCGGGGEDSPVIEPVAQVTTTLSADTVRGVTPGAFCSPEGAHGVTSTGKRMQCSKEGDTRARWRAA